MANLSLQLDLEPKVLKSSSLCSLNTAVISSRTTRILLEVVFMMRVSVMFFPFVFGKANMFVKKRGIPLPVGDNDRKN